ncbi:Cytochrome c oxidase subunit 2 [bacterium HR11]|nr:Cytochrome c oxidase subunit 2 [bacterium HR11]
MSRHIPIFLLEAVSAGIVLVFAYVALRSRRSGTVSPDRARRLQTALLIGLLGFAGLFLAFTFPRAPYPRRAERPDRVVFVVGKQFNFAVSERPITNDREWEEVVQFGEPVTVSAGELVEFRVTSFDVNHGFSLYDPDRTLLGQVQAMPGYVNRLRFRFAKPGRYEVLCLEYCGNGHPRMRGYFYVK